MKIFEDCIGLVDICEVIDWIDLDIVQVFGCCMDYVKVVLCFKVSEVVILVFEWVVVMFFECVCWVEENGFDVFFVEGLFVQIIYWYIVEQIKYWCQIWGVV